MQINILEGRAAYVVLMGCVSVTISYSSRCLTTGTVEYDINDNSFIENLAALQYVSTEMQTNVKANTTK